MAKSRVRERLLQQNRLRQNLLDEEKFLKIATLRCLKMMLMQEDLVNTKPNNHRKEMKYLNQEHKIKCSQLRIYLRILKFKKMFCEI